MNLRLPDRDDALQRDNLKTPPESGASAPSGRLILRVRAACSARKRRTASGRGSGATAP